MKSLEDCSTEDLEKEIERRKKEEEQKSFPIPTNDMNKFKTLSDYIHRNVKHVAEEGYPEKDFEHYVFEIALECTYGGREIWKWWNKHYND